jgi:SNF2 family DNA or RNA helicase
MIKDVKLQIPAGKRLIRVPATIEFKNGRIWFIKSPFNAKNEIKAMKGSRWHGSEDPPRKIWSIEDCPRNKFQLGYLIGNDVYAHFDQPVKEFEYDKPLMEHQKDLANAGLTYHYHIFAAEAGTGKTLSAQCVIEHAGGKWWWVGPKSSIPNIQREFKKWDYQGHPIRYMTYDQLVGIVEEGGYEVPLGVVFDESSRLKNHASQRSQGAQYLADQIREKHGMDGYVILMSGTPSPKSPVDWWSQCEVAWPGFLREGSVKALKLRMAITEELEVTGIKVPKLVSWRDNENKCDECGQFKDAHSDRDHQFKPSKNEVAYLYKRLEGLVTVKLKKDCLTLPEKRYRTIECKPNASTLRVCKSLADAAPNTITGITWLRELSDGFQYKEVVDGETRCKHCVKGVVEEWQDPEDPERTFESIDMMKPELVARLEKIELPCPQCDGSGMRPKKVRKVREVPCPKYKVLTELLEECEEQGRIVIFAAFTGTIDRVVKLCHKEGWNVVRLDGRGYQVTDWQDNPMDEPPLEYWANLDNSKVAFVAHPESGGQSLTLTESQKAVFVSNTHKPENRIQAEERVHRLGMNRGCEIVDIFHLPSDRRVLEIVKDNRRLELMTLGEIIEGIEENED